MRTTVKKLPQNCIHIRFHTNESVDYIEHTIIKPLSKDTCELVGFSAKNLTQEYIRLAFKACADAGYKQCYIERRKNDRVIRKLFNLKRYINGY